MLNTLINEEIPKRTPIPPLTLFIGSIAYLEIGVLNPIMPALIEGRYGDTAFHLIRFAASKLQHKGTAQ